MARLKIADEFSQALDSRLAELLEGQIRLQDLPLSVAAWFYAGEAYGRADRQPEVNRLEHEANSLYMRAYSPKERRVEYQRRLDEHFRLEDQRFFDAAMQQPVPTVTAGQPLNNVHSIRADPASAETGVNDGSSAAPERRGRPAA